MLIFKQITSKTGLHALAVASSIIVQVAIPFPRSDFIAFLMLVIMVGGALALSNLFLLPHFQTGQRRKLSCLSFGSVILIFSILFNVPQHLEASVAPFYGPLNMVWWGTIFYLLRTVTKK